MATATKKRGKRTAQPKTPTTKRVKCRTCSNKAQTRELCWRCHAEAKASIRRGDTTDAELVEKGLMAPLKRMGRPEGSGKSGMAKRLAEIRK